jgi:tetratricopeptide (TPR) repeat protein
LRLVDEGGTGMLGETTITLIPPFRAYALDSAGDFGQAIRDYEQARPSDIWTVNLANEAFDAAQMHDAKRARELVPFIPAKRSRDGKPNPDVALAMFDIAFEAGDWRAALAAAGPADAAYGALPTQQWQRRTFWPLWAYTMAMNGDVAGAEALIARSEPDCDICLRMKGRIAALKHDWKSAGRDFAMVSARSPHVPFADTDWGAMLMAKCDLDSAIAKFESAHAKGPHFADPLEMWGEALIARNRSDLALAKFEEADKYAPNWGRLHLKWGEALFYAGRKDEARKQFAIATHLDLSAADKAALARAGAMGR